MFTMAVTQRLCVYTLLLVSAIAGTKSQFLVPPSNIAELIVNEVTLLCGVSSIPPPNVQWLRFTDEHDNNPTVISNNGAIVHPPYISHMSIRSTTDSGTSSFNLVIHSFRLDLSGRYACRNVLAEQNNNAYLIALASDPVCIPAIAMDRLVIGQSLRITCVITYQITGSTRENEIWAPRMEWTGPSTLNVTDESSPGSFVQTAIVLGLSRGHNGQVYSLNTFFVPPPTPPDGFASNQPLYTHTWSTGPLNVQFPPTEVQISPRGSIIQEGTTLICTGSANPNPSFNWVDEDDGSTVIGQLFTVPSHVEGGNNDMKLRCDAVNIINGLEFTTPSIPLEFTIIGEITNFAPPSNVQISSSASHIPEGTILTCTASGNPQPDISWVEDGRPTVYGAQYTVRNFVYGGDNMVSLKCVATNINHGDEFSAHRQIEFTILSVTNFAPPSNVQISPSASHILEGTTLTCSAFGNPQPDISWVEDGRPTVYGAQYTVRDYVNGGNNTVSLKCVATNINQGTEYSAHRQSEFIISRDTTIGIGTNIQPSHNLFLLSVAIGTIVVSV